MPLHRIYSAKGVFSPSDKEAIARNITNIYSVLPKFYTVVTFVDVDEDSIYVGGKANSRFVRLATQHLARENTNPDRAEMVRSSKLYCICNGQCKITLIMNSVQHKVCSSSDVYMGTRRESLLWCRS